MSYEVSASVASHGNLVLSKKFIDGTWVQQTIEHQIRERRCNAVLSLIYPNEIKRDFSNDVKIFLRPSFCGAE